MARSKRITSFAYLNIAQFAGGLNDNFFKLVIVFLLVHIEGKEQINNILIISGAAFITPFLILSIPSGTLADRFSKRKIIVIVKAIEVVVMLFGVVAFSLETAWLCYFVLFLMASQSAIFGPSKYGIVPELVAPEKIAKANGILTALTVIAMILGSFLASALTQLTDGNFPLIASLAVLIAVIGFIGSLGIQRTPPVGKVRRISPRLVTEVIRVMKRARTENYLFAALWGSSFFYLIGAFIQLNVLPFAIQSLGITAVEGNYIFATAAIGIALGAWLAGRLCGDDVEIGLGPLAGYGITLCLFLMVIFQHSLWTVVAVTFVLGVGGGIYLVPFDAYIQVASPTRHRGENVAAGSFLSFVGIAVAVILLFVFADLFKLSAAQGFLNIAILTAIATLVLTRRLSDTFVRLYSRWRYCGHHHPKVEGKLPDDVPSLILCEAPSWKLGLLLMVIAQQRYMKCAIERPAHLSFGERWLCHLAKVALYDGEPSTVEPKIARWLRRGFSVTILPTSQPDRLQGWSSTLATTLEASAQRAYITDKPSISYLV